MEIEMFENPVLPGDWPDPTVWDGGDGWFYSTATPVNALRRSRNLVDWEEMPGAPAIESETYERFLARTKCIWAPCVTRIGTRFVMYVALFLSDVEDYIEVLVSDSPTGPFHYVRTLIDGKREHIMNAIDPFVHVVDGTPWLFFGSCQDGVFRVPLTEDGLNMRDGAVPEHVAGRRNPTGDGTHNIWGERGTWEAAFPIKRGDWWYLFVSGGKYNNHTYYMTVGRGRSIDGPFFDREGNNMTEGLATPILSSAEGEYFTGPGHNGEVFTDVNGQDWMFFHAHCLSRFPAKYRPSLLQRLYWNAEGWPYFQDGKPQRYEPRPAF